MKETKETIDLLHFEKIFMQDGCKYICGVDEVGRGPLAGPVTVAAVIMPMDDIIPGVNDSKKLSEKKREQLNVLIRQKAIAVSIISADNNRIDEINILNATKECMKKAIMSLAVKPDIVLIDAVKLDLPYRAVAIIKGDALSYSIGAASIVAKVERDTYMRELAKQFPDYGFERNKGYGTAEHIRALKTVGKTSYHRDSFIGGILGGK